jgi:hypothetical protein
VSDRPGDDVPTDPWGNPLPPEQWPRTPPPQGPSQPGPAQPGEDEAGWARPDAPTQQQPRPQHPQPQYRQPQYGQPQYGQPPYGQQWGQDPNQPFGSPWTQPGYGYTPPRTEGMAIGSLVCAVVGICACGLLLGPIAVVLGFVARNRIRESNGTLTGEGLALAGIIVGIVAFVLAIVGAIYYLNNPDIFEFDTN